MWMMFLFPAIESLIVEIKQILHKVFTINDLGVAHYIFGDGDC